MHYLVTATAVMIALSGCANLFESSRLDANMGPRHSDDPGEQSTPLPTPTPEPKDSRVWATMDGQFSVTSAVSGTLLKFDNVLEDAGDEWNPNGYFVSHHGGRYQVSAQITLMGPWADGEYCKLVISKSKTGPVAVNQAAPTSPGGTCSLYGGIMITLAPNQAIAIYAIAAGGSAHRTYPTQYNPYNYVTIQAVPSN